MQLICKICGRPFEWEKIKSSRTPTICGKRDKNGKWIQNRECYLERKRIAAREYYLRNNKPPDNPEYRHCIECGNLFKTKAYNNYVCSDACRKIRKKRANKRAHKARGLKYNYKNKPKPDVKRYCKWPGCRRLTSNGGVDYYYCDYHKFVLEQRVGFSEQYPEFIYNTSNDMI